MGFDGMKWCSMGFDGTYPLRNVYTTRTGIHHHCFAGKTHVVSTGPFSRAMLFFSPRGYKIHEHPISL